MGGKRKYARGTMIGGVIDEVVEKITNNASISQSTRSTSQVNEHENEVAQSHASTTRTSTTSHGSTTPAASGPRKRKGRGTSHLPALWGSGTPLEVSLNEHFQCIGKHQAQLSTALGVLARMGNLLPLSYRKWSDMPPSRHDDVWNDVQANTTLPPEAKDYVLKNLNSLWKDWKKDVKSKYFTPHKDDPEYLLTVPDDRLEPSQWSILVTYWNEEEVQEQATKNAANRREQQHQHRAGQKPFPVVREEIKETGITDPTRLDVFLETRCRGQELIPNSDTSILCDELRNQVQQVPEDERTKKFKNDLMDNALGRDGHGRVRCMGKGVTPTQFNGRPMSRTQEIEEVREQFRGKIEDMEAKLSETQAQMKILLTMLNSSALQAFHAATSSGGTSGHVDTSGQAMSGSNATPDLQDD